MGFKRDKEVLRTMQVFQTLILSLVEMGKFSAIDDSITQSLFKENLECSKKT